jgi:hypothetical protein
VCTDLYAAVLRPKKTRIWEQSQQRLGVVLLGPVIIRPSFVSVHWLHYKEVVTVATGQDLSRLALYRWCVHTQVALSAVQFKTDELPQKVFLSVFGGDDVGPCDFESLLAAIEIIEGEETESLTSPLFPDPLTGLYKICLAVP